MDWFRPTAISSRPWKALTIGCYCFLLLTFAGCATAPPAASLQRFEYVELHMGSLFRITLYAPDRARADAAAVAGYRRVAELDNIMSDYDPHSELMRLCQKPAETPEHVSRDLFDILQYSQKVSEESGGVFDVTVGPFVQLWRTARKKKALPAPAELAEAARVVGYRKLVLDAREQTATLAVPNMRLDLGGIAKGYAADQALAVMRRMSTTRAMVAASGDIALGDPPPGRTGWAIGIASIDPKDEGVSKTVLLKNAGISTSGDAEQYVEINGVRYSHIIDPATGLGLTNRIQATIIGPNATTTDGLDNTICGMGVERGLKLIDSLPGTAAVVSTWDASGKRVFPSRRFKKEFGGH